MGGPGEAVKYVVNTKFGQSFVAGGVVEGVKAVHEDAGNLLGGVLELAMADADEAALDNPYFAQNGHDGESPVTNRYLRAKRCLGVVGTIGTALLDVGGYTSGASAVQSSVVWYRINALFERMVPASRRAQPPQYAAWYSWTVAKKAVPSGSLEIQMTRILRQKMYGAAGGATKAGIAFGTGGLLGIFVNAASSQLQERLDAIFGQDVQTLAQGLHWYAFRESVVGGVHGGGKGPSLRILELLWQQFALGHGGIVSIANVVREPRGWLVIADLLN
jgi:hypothetical protein